MTPPREQIFDAETQAPQPPPPEPAGIRAQLDRLLASRHLRTSKRCQALLKYVVEAYLNGALDQVKERTIGFEVFQREPGYDTNQDSVVRTTAADARKRLAQYYLEPGHEYEIQVRLPQGCYVPEFRVPPPPPAVPTVAVALPVALAPAAPPPAKTPRSARAWLIVAAAAVFAAVGLWLVSNRRPNELEAFWKPLLDDRADALLCIEQPLRIYMFDGPRTNELNQKMVGSDTAPAATDAVRQATPVSLSELKTVGSRYFSFGDTIASVRLAEFLGRSAKRFQVLGDRAASYHDLRGKPAVLVGEFNNRWTLGLTGGLRYYLEKNAAKYTYEVRDRQNAGKVIASASQEPGRPVQYVIVSRVLDASTEKTLITAAGMTYSGTSAAGDFLTNPAYMRQAFEKAPANWYRRNIQVVLETAMVSGIAGPPKVIASHFW